MGREIFRLNVPGLLKMPGRASARPVPEASGRRAAGKKKRPSAPKSGTKGRSFRGTTQIRARRRALEAPVTEGGPAMSPWRLPGERRESYSDRLSAGGPSSLGKAESLFSRSSHDQNDEINYYL